MLYNREVTHSDQSVAPGELSHLPGYEYHPTELQLMDYDSEHLTETTVDDPSVMADMIDQDSVTWLNVNGLQNLDVLKKIQSLFRIHPLVVEDILRPYQRPKFELYDDHLFLVFQLLHLQEQHKTEQIGFVIGRHYLITFQEFSGDDFDPVRQRIRDARRRLRTGGPDYLAYALLDSIVDSYFPVLERIGNEIDELEDRILDEPREENLTALHNHKRTLLILRRSAWAQRETLGQLQREEHDFVSADTRIYLRDAYDHAIRILEVIEAYREMTTSLTDLHMTSVSNRMNEIMKVLTIIGTIFLPLTFIAGVYGMNFDPEASPWNMPELYWYWGYPTVLGVMAIIAVALLVYFRHKKWI